MLWVMLMRLSQTLCQTVLTTNILVCIWPPLQGSSHLGHYWVHFPPSQLQIPVSFANIGAHANFIVLAKLLRVSWSFTKPVTRLWPIKPTSNVHAWQKAWKHLGPALSHCGKCRDPCWLPSQWAGARLPLNWLCTSQNKDKQSFKWLGFKKNWHNFCKFSQDLDINLQVTLNVKNYYVTVTIVQIVCARH